VVDDVSGESVRQWVVGFDSVAPPSAPDRRGVNTVAALTISARIVANADLGAKPSQN
jgi:hypothetical protein